MNLLRQLIRALNHDRPWWWRALVRLTGWDRLGWQITGTGHRIVLPGRHPWLDLQLTGQGHHIEVHPGAVLRGVVLDVRGEGHRITVGPGWVLNQVYIRLRGRRHTLHLEARVRFTRGGGSGWKTSMAPCTLAREPPWCRPTSR